MPKAEQSCADSLRDPAVVVVVVAVELHAALAIAAIAAAGLADVEDAVVVAAAFQRMAWRHVKQHHAVLGHCSCSQKGWPRKAGTPGYGATNALVESVAPLEIAAAISSNCPPSDGGRSREKHGEKRAMP